MSPPAAMQGNMAPQHAQRPPGKGRAFLRRGHNEPTIEAEPSSASQLRALQLLSGLEGLAPKLCVVLVSSDMDSEDLHSLGFFDVKTHEQLLEEFPRAWTHQRVDGILTLAIIDDAGADVTSVTECLQTLDEVSDLPANMAVLAVTQGEQSSDFERETQTIQALLSLGADDVMMLFSQDELSVSRVETAIVRTEAMANRASEMINEQVEKVKEKQRRTLKVLSQEYLWQLPGAEGVIWSIPRMDESLHEQFGQGCRVGRYAITTQLEVTALGAIFKAEHPEFGARAMKVIPKSNIKSACQLFNISNELCIMQSLSPHPNVVKAYEALHGKPTIMLVMAYCGDLNLHGYILKTLKDTGEPTLPEHLALSFCRQAAAGVAHLHASQVCHRNLNPKCMIVDEGDRVLRLADFHLACMTFGSEHKLRSMCGSLPFVAPEVLALSKDAKGKQGYCGFSTDVWSLGLCFTELGYGLFHVEQLLGWVPEPPLEAGQRQRDLETLPEIWQDLAEMCVPGLLGLVKNMVAVRSSDRWSMRMIARSPGFALDPAER